MRPRRWGLLLLLGWLGQVAVRLWLSAGQSMPVATPDETGYLFAARVLTGGPGADMSFGTVYRGGYSLLLAPAFLVTDDPEAGYRIALAINALINAAMLPLAYVLLRRLELTPRPAYVLAHVTALLPGVAFYSEFVLTDAVLPIVVIAWLLLAHNWLTASASPARVTLYGTGVGVLAAFAYASHTRGLMLMAVSGGLLLISGVCRWRPWHMVAIAFTAMGAVATAGTVLNHRLLPHLYPNGDNDLGGNLVDRLTSVEGYGWFLSLGTGQVWYQIVATAGLAGIGLITVAAVAVRRGTAPHLRVLAACVLVLVFGIAFATSAALPDEYRVGNYVYGRYLACVTPILFAVGAAVLLRASRRTALLVAGSAAGLAVVTGGIVQLYAGDRLKRYTYTAYDFPDVSFLTWNWAEFRLWPATLAALVLLGLALLAARLPRHPSAVLGGLLIAVHMAVLVTATTQISRPLVKNYSSYTDLSRTADPAERPIVAMDWNVPWKLRMPQLYGLGRSETRTFDSSYQKPPADAEVVILNWDGRKAPGKTWKNPPQGWYVSDSRSTPEGAWVAWVRD
ncbi:hypothetical protein [Spirillospora sp. CA-294931]|uniref:hypothetical protein n=1 Tax=Spirillospora sp. CA-294931 TaxID=3240042 RepID=UPI003D8A5BC6